MADDSAPTDLDKITGFLRSVTNKEPLDRRTVWLAYETVEGASQTVRTITDADAAFAFDPPVEALAMAHVGAEVEGAAVVDLEPNGERLEPGDLVVFVDDIVPVHLRVSG